MTHPNFVTNGASLEDCHTNFFALADLCGIKWRRYFAESVLCFEPLDDPVLSSFSKCLAADILCVWRRVFSQGHDQHRNHQDRNQLNYKKELWVFWYGEEPDLTGLVSPDLTADLDQGSWESGLSYECRTLLFKSLHNLIERSLLSKGFSRIQKWFVQPYDANEKSIRSPQLSFCFNFFIHGESTVCASMDVRQRIPVCQLSRQHITLAQGNHTGLRVILCPSGMAGTLTGQSYKDDINTQRLLSEWAHFYPLRSSEDDQSMALVEVMIGGIRLRYPSSYILVSELDESASSSFYASQPKSSHTLPVSPCDTSVRGFPSSDLTAWRIKEAVWQDSSLQGHKPTEAGVWDFSDPASIVKCDCSRSKSVKQEKANNSKMPPSTSSVPTTGNVSASVDSPSSTTSSSGAVRKADKSEKLKQQTRYRTSIPFHKRTTYSDISDTDSAFPVSGSASVNTNFQFKGLSQSLRSSTPSGLPQLHTSVNQPSASPPSGTHLTDGTNSQSSMEPLMPTLSPHPPPIKEEEGEESQDPKSPPSENKDPIPTDQSVYQNDGIIPAENIKTEVKSESSPQNCCEEKTPETTEDPPKPTRPQGLKRPALSVCSHDDPHDELVMDGLLYDYTFFSNPLWDSKRRKVWPFQRVKTEEEDVEDNKETQMDETSSFKQKDPYEFNDEFEEDSPSSDFRTRPNEEELKPKDPSTSETPIVAPVQEPPKPPVEQPISPDSPQNFIAEKDLSMPDTVTDNFDDSSSDESGDDMDPSTPLSAKLCGTPEEPTGKCKNNSFSSGMLCAAELTRMFPTPPSLEHNTAQSPSGPYCGTDLSILDSTDCYRSETYLDGGCSPYYEPVKDWSFVYKLPVQYKFIGSQRYAPLSTLPSQVQPLPLQHVYKPSWTNTSSTSTFQTERISAVPNSQFPLMQEGERMVPPMFSVEPPMDPRTLPMNYELQSPASSASSYLNKHLNSVDSSGTASSIPEAHSLLVNLVIADSMLNLFKDHNFASCTVCVCNMNTKGSDAGINLPSSLIPSGTDEPQYKCTCGFSAVVNRHQSHRAGIFYEDELDITGHRYETFFCRKSLSLVESSKKTDEEDSSVDHIPHPIVELLKVQCSHIYSTFSLFHKAEQFRHSDRYQYNSLEISDGCEVCFLALDTGRQAVDNINNNKMDENLKSSCLHKWPYLAAKIPVSNVEVVHLLRSLQPLLQEAVQQKRHQRLWEVTYPVLGPLTWRQFHRLAGRGTEDQCEPQPIPSILVGYDQDWVALSPFALKYWDKLLLEPYTHSRDVAYVVVAPDNDCVLTPIKKYFKELSSVYEICRLGRHCPITKVLRDGIMRVGKGTAKKLADEPVDDWFSLIGDGPIASRLKLYAQACRYHLAPHLATQSFDSSLIDSVLKPPENASPKTSEDTPQFKTEVDIKTEAPSAESSSSATPCEPIDVEDSKQTPTLVIYLVEPFTHGSADPDVYRLASLGLLRSYTHMLQFLPEHIRNNIHLQLVTLDSILSLGRMENAERRKDQLKALAFSVFSQCHQVSTHQAIAKSLTGFGPAAAQDRFLKSRDARNSIVSPQPSKIFTLAPQKDKQTELGEMFGDRREKSGVMYCTYCLTEDQRWLIASCTDDKGDVLQTCCINIEVPNRTRRKKVSVRRLALQKLLDFIVEVLSKCLHTWRLVISRLGRLGHMELRDWASLLSRKSLLRYSRQLRDLCHQCAVLGPSDSPAILTACLVSLEPDSSLRVMADQFTPDDRFSSSCNSCCLSTPEDASCTHILVFPTSATTQSSQATFQQEHIDPLSTTLGDDDLFQALNDDDIAVGNDISDIFRWTESPPQSPSKDSISQPGSPGMGGGNFHHGSSNRGSGNSSHDSGDEPLQVLQQPLALGYYVSTAKTGPLPKWFWSTCPQLQNVCPVFLKSALLIHSPFVQQSSDDLLHANPHTRNYHPLDSNLTTDVLRYVLEGFNSLSWLSLDPSTHDRRSCLPVHIQVLMQLYQAVEALI